MSDRKMDSRCPRKLLELPTQACPLAVLRLKQLRNSPAELSEEEESKLSGCCWAISHQMSNYCFFNYLKDYLNEAPSDKEIAHMNNISVETVKQIENKALNKIKNMDVILENDN